MASMFSWLRRVWSGSRNESCHDYPVTYASSYPPSNVVQPSHTKGLTAAASELPVTAVSYPDLGFAGQGVLNLYLNTVDNTFTSNPNIGLNPVSGSSPRLGGIIGICLNTADNTWTSDRPIYLDPINEQTPESGTDPTRTSSVAAMSSPSTVQRHDHAGLRASALGSTVSLTSGSERGQSTRYRDQRSVSAVSRTESGDSMHRAHERSASSTQTLSPAPSNAAPMPSLSEMETLTPGRNERSASTASRTERGDPRRTHGRSPSSTDLLSPAAELESTGSLDPYPPRRFDTAFSPPTPPESSTVPYDNPFIKRERSPSTSPSGSSRHVNVNVQPQMEQITRTRAQPAAVTEPFQTPSKPPRHSTIVSNHSVGGLSTPPMTDSARRHAPFIFGAQVGEGSQTTVPPSPTSPTPSHRHQTDNTPVTVAQPLAPTNPPTTATQPITPAAVDPTARHPIRKSDTMEFTSLKEIYAQPLTNGYRILPTRGPECLACHQRMTLQAPTRGGPNDGRRYYSCVAGGHGWNFGTFADVEGRDESRTCDCGEPSRRTETQKGGQFWKCMEMNCTWKSFS